MFLPARQRNVRLDRLLPRLALASTNANRNLFLIIVAINTYISATLGARVQGFYRIFPTEPYTRMRFGLSEASLAPEPASGPIT
jgi:hypothetical protein